MKKPKIELESSKQYLQLKRPASLKRIGKREGIREMNSNSNVSAGAFYQPSNQFSFPQGSMSFQAPNYNDSNTNGNMNIQPDPLPSGLINALSTKGYAHEPPLLEELGINFDHITRKTKIVLMPTTSINNNVSQEILNDSDLSGPLIFFLLFGLFLLMSGKVHFGYIYGVALFGSISLHTLSKFMSSNNNSNLRFFNTMSILGYCFLPLCFLTLLAIFINLNNSLGYFAGSLFVFWSTWSSSGFLNSLLQLHSARALIAYPLFIFYSVFALMAIFV
ncbi:hypothetical protein KAFR_0K00970 [Kazachstania africana CBS 2517]|uniref:Protein YIP n=1 Tax=Kazachstania africana (strain ATCC 22294 / BCRC 22015 / CBS 2517 / CECT 1963 / NBRC 1671 / NRRL Y-8276) TaxID=1071382 RepID=H2B1F3_KAZAF|nr:hypothetical protein KAFR_0K00970 [Kazachstania africana CBS 2517]CCF60453.1 hypothetical protein KAFR_0K00970 [Kazachstania africana CBS 2517]